MNESPKKRTNVQKTRSDPRVLLAGLVLAVLRHSVRRPSQSTVFVVRHAERADAGTKPPTRPPIRICRPMVAPVPSRSRRC